MSADVRRVRSWGHRGRGCQAGDPGALHHLLAVVWAEFRQRAIDRKTETKRDREKETQRQTDTHSQAQPEMEGDVKRLGWEKETEKRHRGKERVPYTPERESKRPRGGWPGARWGSDGRKPLPQHSQSSSPPHPPEQCPSPRKDSTRLRQEELQAAACETGVDFGECGKGQEAACRRRSASRPDVNRTPSCPCFPSVQGQAGVHEVLHLQSLHLLQHETRRHHQEG